MCLNRGRLRRRLRKTLRDDWCHLYQHALNADACPELKSSLANAGWTWLPVAADASFDSQVRAVLKGGRLRVDGVLTMCVCCVVGKTK